jgi:hypothetical protein
LASLYKISAVTWQDQFGHRERNATVTEQEDGWPTLEPDHSTPNRDEAPTMPRIIITSPTVVESENGQLNILGRINPNLSLHDEFPNIQRFQAETPSINGSLADRKSDLLLDVSSNKSRELSTVSGNRLLGEALLQENALARFDKNEIWEKIGGSDSRIGCFGSEVGVLNLLLTKAMAKDENVKNALDALYHPSEFDYRQIGLFNTRNIEDKVDPIYKPMLRHNENWLLDTDSRDGSLNIFFDPIRRNEDVKIGNLLIAANQYFNNNPPEKTSVLTDAYKEKGTEITSWRDDVWNDESVHTPFDRSMDRKAPLPTQQHDTLFFNVPPPPPLTQHEIEEKATADKADGSRNNPPPFLLGKPRDTGRVHSSGDEDLPQQTQTISVDKEKENQMEQAYKRAQNRRARLQDRGPFFSSGR